ncbi:COR domain-containing protein [Candidatus Halobeggiatoa sp. HSG11]|nr:COR domain-containing protein [Candidatus Halobeggiatoa sp. HSG11]
MNNQKLLQLIEETARNKEISLNLGRQQLTSLPPELFQLVNLRELNLRRNQLTSLPSEISQLVNLQVLNLRGNKLTSLPPEISQLVNLQVLNLRVNKLTSLPPEFSQLVNLKTLYLDGNKLTNLPPEISQLVNLKSLSLSGNQLVSLPAKIFQLINLQKLNIDRNKLTSLPTEFSQLAQQIEKNGGMLYLKGNPLPIPPEILEDVQYPTKITNYYFQLQDSKPLNEAKMLIVGQGGVGKTSLVNRLTKDNYNQAENKTEGIQITNWQLPVKDATIRLNIWDFGGQEIMHATHQFFLTKRSLYILVLDARQGEQESRVEYWLKLIQSFAADSPIIIAINKSDQHPLPINERGLKAKYPSLQDFFKISCETSKGIPELIENIKYQLDNLTHVHDPFPSKWFLVKQTLENMSEDFISYDQYVQQCQQQGIPEEINQHTLIDFLHDLGIVLNFREDKLRPQLCDTNILNPEWVTEAVYTLINSHKLHETRGVLELNQLGTFLDTKRYPKDRQSLIIEIMEKFELCFAIKDAEKYLIPELLHPEEPDLNWDNDNSLAFQYKYDVLPSSVISRFIVRMHQSISKKTYWRTGVVLVENDNKALVKADIEDKTIFIWVIGNTITRRKFLTKIREQFNDIHKSIPKINAQEQVPYKTVIIPHNDLLKLEKMQENVIIIPKLEERVPISKLLDGIEKIKVYESSKEELSPKLQESPPQKTKLSIAAEWATIIAVLVGIIGVIVTIIIAL